MACCRVPAARHFDNLAAVQGLSSALIQDHYRLYLGYVNKAHELCGLHAQAVRLKHDATDADLRNLKRDLTFTLAAARNHELYFGLLGREPSPRAPVLMQALREDFGPFENYIADLTRTALSTHGWAFTLVDHHTGHLINVTSAQNGQFPMWNASPVLAIDMADHAYFYDYGSHRTEYLSAIIGNLHWPTVAENLAAAHAVHAAATPHAPAPYAATPAADSPEATLPAMGSEKLLARS